VYDPLGRSYVEINANGGRTTTVFNAVGQTAALVDALGNRHSFTYDSTGAQTQLIDPLNRRTTSAYDTAGQQSLRIDARSNRTSFVYSPVGQLTSRKYPDGSRASFSYDTVGNRTLMADSTGRYTATYDAVGQTTVTASPNGQRQSFSYDAVGKRRSMDATGAGRSTYQYDAANQISSLLNPYSERTTFGYDDAGRRNVQRNANGTRVSLAYDAASQTTQVFHRTSAGASVLQLDYQYDNAGNRKSMAEDGSAARTTWTYDKQHQLLSEYRTGTNPYRQTFAYDDTGNRTLKNIDSVRTTYAYDVANQVKYGQAAAGRTSFAYDATGNQRIEQPPTGNRTTTTWNFENQPTQYLLPAGSPVTMSYNGDNRRVISQQGATSTKFVWDATTDAYLAELDGANAVQAVYTNEPQHYGSVVSQRRSSTSHWPHADALGTTRLLTSSTQTTTDTYLLDAWGNSVTSSGTTVNPFRWVGRYGYYQDASTGLVYVRARMYMPTVARWVSLDPLAFIDGMNQYRYVKNSSTTFVDPSGLKYIKCHCRRYQAIYPGTPSSETYAVLVDCSASITTCCSEACDGPLSEWTGKVTDPSFPNFPEKGCQPALANPPAGFFQYWASCCPQRDTIVQTLGSLALPVCQLSSGEMAGQVAGGYHKVYAGLPQKGSVYGGGGNASSVTVVIVCPGRGVTTFHFGTINSDVRASLARYDWPLDCHAAISGGDSESSSRCMLHEVALTMQELGVSVDGISDHSGVFVDASGNWCRGKSDLPCLDHRRGCS
jgi:RHS repeat-associated protein